MKLKNRLPKWMTTVTWWTKLIALGMYIVLPVIGFWFGAEYEEHITKSAYLYQDLIRKCPDDWNEGKVLGSNPAYVEIDGKHVEFSEVDIVWIKNNCETVTPKRDY